MIIALLVDRAVAVAKIFQLLQGFCETRKVKAIEALRVLTDASPNALAWATARAADGVIAVATTQRNDEDFGTAGRRRNAELFDGGAEVLILGRVTSASGRLVARAALTDKRRTTQILTGPDGVVEIRACKSAEDVVVHVTRRAADGSETVITSLYDNPEQKKRADSERDWFKGMLGGPKA